MDSMVVFHWKNSFWAKTVGLHLLQEDELFPLSVEPLYQLEFSRETGPRRCVYTYIHTGPRRWYLSYLSIICLRERLGSWQLWGLASLKSVGQVGRWETQVGFLCCSLEAELLLLQTWVFALQAFHWLDKAHSHSGGFSPLFKIYGL